MLVVIILLLTAAMIKLVAAVCGHTITWRLAVLLTIVLAVVVANLIW